MVDFEWNELRDEVVEASTIALLEAYDVAAKPSHASSGKPSHAAIIGFAGDGIRGSLTLAMTPEVVRASAPVGLCGVAVSDWLGELANQLLGRVKNRLLVHGVNMEVTTPVVVSAWSGLHVHDGSNASEQYAFETPSGGLQVLFAHDTDDDFALFDTRPSRVMGAVTTGEVTLF